MNAVVTAMGWFDGAEWGRADGPVGAKRADASIAWRDVSPRPFDRFGRMGALAKAALVAAEMLDLPLVDQAGKSPVGVLLGTRYGVFSQDHAFIQTISRPEGPSPLLFPHTLPVAAVGEVSIRFGLTGPGLVFYDAVAPLAKVLHEALCLIETGESDRVMCLACDASQADDAFLLPRGRPAPGTGATALLLSRCDESNVAADALAAVTFEPGGEGGRTMDDLTEWRRWWSGSTAEPLLLATDVGSVVFTRNVQTGRGAPQRR